MQGHRTNNTARLLAAALTLVLLSFSYLVMAQGGQRLQRPYQMPRGDTVTPAYEGWYRNSEGRIAVVFGYYNRNTEEVVYLPVGPDNRLEPASVEQAQPEYFQPGRQAGAFVVEVPEGYRGEVWWTLSLRGEKVSIPANLAAEYRIDVTGPTLMGNTPPRLRFDAGPVSQGPVGQVVGPLSGRVGEPLTLRTWVDDDGIGGAHGGEGNLPIIDRPVVSLQFSSYRGPAPVEFSDSVLQWSKAQGEAPLAVTATFHKPGHYRLRVLASDVNGAPGGGQCCWTNAYLDIEIDQ